MIKFKGKAVSAFGFTYQGQAALKEKDQWRAYFIGAEKGREYNVLVENSTGQLVMSDTPVEKRSCQEIVDKARGDVLIIGLGLNVINDKVLKVKGVTSVSTMEVDQDVIDNVPTKTTVIKHDATLPNVELNGHFDVIYWDAFDSFNPDVVLPWLKEGGEFISWDINYGS